jgi:hypothetical protein
MSLTSPRQRVSASGSASGIQEGECKGETDAEWLEELKSKFATIGVNVEEQRIKAEAWISTKGRGRQFTRKFFVNWLNRCDTKILTAVKPTARQLTPEELRRAREYAAEQAEWENKNAIHQS